MVGRLRSRQRFRSAATVSSQNRRRGNQRDRTDTPLFDENAERAIIGICLSDQQVFLQAQAKLKPHYFTVPRLARVWEALCRSADAGKPMNRTFIAMFIRGDSEETTPLGIFLQVLINEAPPASEGEIYVDTVAALAHKRQLVDALKRATDEIMKMDIASPVEHMVDVAIREATSSVDAENDEFMRSIGDWGLKVYRDAERAVRSTEEDQDVGVGLPCGLAAVEEVIGRLLPGKVYVLAGMSGGGKSALARQITEAAARYAGKHKLGEVIISSLEMPGDEYTARSLSEMMGVPSYRIEQGDLNTSELEFLAERSLDLRSLPITIDSKPRQTIKDIRTRWLRTKQRKGALAAGVIDHLILIGGKEDKMHDRVAENTAEAKNMAKEFGIPVILLAQLNEKNILERSSGWPNFSDLFGGQTIKMNSDVVFFIHRPEEVLKTREPNKNDDDKHAKWVERMDRERGKAWVWTDKRRGAQASLKRELIFHGETMSFRDI